MVIGVGTNLKPHHSFGDLPKGYACLCEGLPGISHLDLIAVAIECFNEGIQKYVDAELLRKEWLEKAWVKPGSLVKLLADGVEHTGTFAGLSASGGLVVRSNQGPLITVSPTCTDFQLSLLSG